TMTDIINKIKELAKKPFFLKAAVAAGLLMIILILVSDFKGEEEKERSDADVNVLSFTSAELYADETEKRLCETLTEIEGVGKAKVMLTITSTEEYVYAESVKSGASQTENSYVIIDKGSQKEALVKKINNPAISGVVIVCEGGDDPKVCERIYNAVSTALNIPTNKIYVAEMK
ncbi:MAG: hypothetical protein K2J76_09685, partial [Oscillospiraceae bacterium]|nr:hypothetical protein [Oscillospiraceae bacterium]